MGTTPYTPKVGRDRGAADNVWGSRTRDTGQLLAQRLHASEGDATARRSEIELREDTVAPSGAIRPQVESLFDRYSWLYAFCRERLFRDDTDRVALALWPVGPPPLGSQLLST